MGVQRTRFRAARVFLVLPLVIAGLRLVQVQVIDADSLSRVAEQERATPLVELAPRGPIVDRNGRSLAFSRDTRMLTMNPRELRENWQRDAGSMRTQGLGEDYEQYTQRLASYVGDANLVSAIRADTTYLVLATDVDPSQAEAIARRYAFIRSYRRQQRIYPDGVLAKGVLGTASWQSNRLLGTSGLEGTWDDQLRGVDGKEMVDTASGDDSWELPGTVRDAVSAVPGVQLKLTIDTDVQYEAEQLPAVGAVVLDARTGEIYAYAGDRSAFQPGAVGAIAGDDEAGARSGEQYSDLLGRLGLGKAAGIGISGEAAGTVPPPNQWTATTRSQLAAGLGMRTSLLQLASMYQAIADDGARVPPRLVLEQDEPGGNVVVEPTPDAVRAVSVSSAAVIRDQNGLAVLPGYRMAGRVGACGMPAQQYCAVAMLPADNPRFVIGLRSTEDPTPLLRRLAGYLVRHFQVPMP